MSRSKLALLACVSGAALTLSGCQEGAGFNFAKKGDDGAATASADRPAATKLVERDVESPEVFQKTEDGLWDGRPSLGGVWVAYPDVNDPERVIIRNEENGKFVIGALFRRERENPGPLLQVSSDAALALDILAGKPTELNVTALRREEIQPDPLPETEEPVETAGLVEPDVISDETVNDPIASAAAAIDRAEDGEAVIEGEGTELAAAEAADPAPKKKKRWNLFRKKQAEPVITPAEGAVETAAIATATTVEAASEAISGDDIVVAALDDPAGESTAPVAEPKPKKKKRFTLFKRKKADPEPVVATEPITDQTYRTTASGTEIVGDAAPAPVQVAAVTPARPSLKKPFIQIGIFSVEDNANRTADLMRKNGIVPTVFEQKSSGKKFWRVVVGPTTTTAERSALLEKVKSAGYSDAYYVTN